MPKEIREPSKPEPMNEPGSRPPKGRDPDPSRKSPPEGDPLPKPRAPEGDPPKPKRDTPPVRAI